MLSYTDLKKGILFTKDNEPHQVLEANFSRMQQRKAVVQTKIRNLRTGKITDMTLQPSDRYEEANVQKRPLQFIYHHRDEFVFTDPADKKNRFSLSEETLGDNKKWLKPNTEVTALFFNDNLLNFTIPIKMDLKVSDAPPGIQGDRAQGGTKTVTVETGAVLQAPLFINTGDIIRVNTETGEYAERVEKA
jgi:elongation factor P